MRERRSGRVRWVPAALLPLLVPASPAGAALGDTLASIERDRRQLEGTLRSTASASYVVHEIETPEGGRVRELASPSGIVFGVAWEGPRLPDPRQLLGAHFDAYAEAARQRRGRRGPLVLELPGAVGPRWAAVR